ncbi:MULTISPECIES: ubiquitin-like protein Pup [Paeniglutamicibacter]|uniref:Prokaryotic ubiquitin-like protein Pup n=1 Tax=Paeniglutamicibacter sulfureus TaxID=43666 RepID=A0ABU2BD18_9MICC|nr:MULTISPECIES: ubiquitin-like protein Pup [Paeniglutamicibacter]MCV9996012.1 ubiquitin-like protein Pup [Paeniglutamicibacter sp. ZC-3]MDO2936235.1 ubiquitin-like protein Pup [Paeniglutamicibacter sulfureus]MDR7356513.1 ubiquitin-like protein Pup [Paeniglutamicibacter sulfureus]
MTQEQHSGQRREDTQAQETEQEVAAAAGQDAGVDDLLDEIDGVLERNAEEFVRGFVQKGGQ